VAQDITGFFREHFPIIKAKCARMLGSGEDAADVAQETFLRLCAGPVAHEPAPARLRWIYVTGTRLCIDRIRRRRLGIEIDAGAGASETLASAVPAPDGRLAARQALTQLAAVLAPDDLAALVMARFDRMPQDEIAAVFAISSRQVRRMLVRAEAQLAALALQIG
jgi:RNA polymerase sigma factor (sigma-70 family)